MADHVELVKRVKHVQRSSEEGKLAWVQFCAQGHGGIRDPNRHTAHALQAFLDSMSLVQVDGDQSGSARAAPYHCDPANIPRLDGGTFGKDHSTQPIIGFDCEMVSGRHGGIAYRRVVCSIAIVNRAEVLFNKLVYPWCECVTDWKTEFHGLKESDFHDASAVAFIEAQKVLSTHIHRSLSEGGLIVGHGIFHDFEVMDIPYPCTSLVRDTAEFFTIHRGGRRQTPSLKKLAAVVLDDSVQVKDHAPNEDALAAVSIYRRYAELWEKIYSHKDARSVFQNVQREWGTRAHDDRLSTLIAIGLGTEGQLWDEVLQRLWGKMDGI